MENKYFKTLSSHLPKLSTQAQSSLPRPKITRIFHSGAKVIWTLAILNLWKLGPKWYSKCIEYNTKRQRWWASKDGSWEVPSVWGMGNPLILRSWATEKTCSPAVSTLESSPLSLEPALLPAKYISTNSSGTKLTEVLLEDDKEELLADAIHRRNFFGQKGSLSFPWNCLLQWPLSPN